MKLEKKFTPGPYTALESSWRDILVGPDDGHTVAVCSCDEEDIADEYRLDEEQNKANAQLIAAAPDLVDALCECLAVLEYGCENYDGLNDCGECDNCRSKNAAWYALKKAGVLVEK